MSVETAIRAFNEKVRNVAEDEFRARCLALANSTIRNTPVDTGRLRANWQATIDRPATEQREAPGGANEAANAAAATAIATRQVANAIRGLRADKIFYLTNNLPYAQAVEEGTDKTPPRRMLARAIQQAASRF